MRFAIVNETPNTNAGVAMSDLIAIAEALTKQSNEDVGPWWETTPDEFDVYPALGQVPLHPAGQNPPTIFHIVSSIPEAPDALAYHTVDALGRPVLRLGWEAIKSAGGSATKSSVSLSCAMSHEAIETKMNPYVDRWADMPDGVSEVAHEACDPVEADSYEIDGVAVSNFVGPRWFSTGPGPYDKMGTVTAAFTMSSNGYMVVRTGGPTGSSSEVFGDKVTEAKRKHVREYGRVRSLGALSWGEEPGWAVDTHPGT